MKEQQYSIQDFAQLIAKLSQIPAHKVLKTIELLKEGSTLPFIARYRKEATGSLDEVEIATIKDQLDRLEDLAKRKETILQTIEEQGKLSPELKRSIEQCWDSTTLEDLYLPYKPKRKTKASIAREKGLEPLALWLYEQNNGVPQQKAEKFLNDEVPSIEEALQGARDIIAEMINEDNQVRNKVRYIFNKEAVVHSKVARNKEEEGEKYKDYFEFDEPLSKIPSHRMLAIRRGETEGFLRVNIAPDKENVLYNLEKYLLKSHNEASKQVEIALHDAYDRLLQPSIENEFRNLSKDKADEEAIGVFAENLKQLLLSAPLGQKRIIGLDPGFRTGCKVVVINESGDLVENTNIYPHPPQNQYTEAQQTLRHLIDKHHIEAIAVGNGTAGRETLSLCQSLKQDFPLEVFMVNESGASIYSASEIAREEFPAHDITVRGAVSIGRRLMDPLAELVKIDAKSIGVGQYQHDVNQAALKNTLDRVVESCVNAVGINLNTASKHLLTYVSGLGPVLAQNIVQYRSENGAFKFRKDLKKVARLGDKAFEQCAGFLRIREGQHPLDNTGVHPESYAVVEQMAKDLGVTIPQLMEDATLRKQVILSKYVSANIGMPTLQDILQELAKPGLDPRGAAKSFSFAEGVHSMDDLRVGMILPGIVTNITNFGAFVDIGVKQDGMVHISQLANKFVKNPNDIVHLGMEVKAKITDLDLGRKRIQLSMKEAL